MLFIYLFIYYAAFNAPCVNQRDESQVLSINLIKSNQIKFFRDTIYMSNTASVKQTCQQDTKTGQIVHRRRCSDDTIRQW